MRISLLFVLLFCLKIAAAQSVVELENRLNKETDRAAKMRLCFQLAEKTLGTNPSKSTEFANRAANLASEINDKTMVAESRYLHGQGYERLRDASNAAARYKMGVTAGKEAGGPGLDAALNCLEKLQDLAIKKANFREALDWSKQAVELLQKGSAGASGRDLEKKYAAQRERLEQEKLRLDAEKRQLMTEISLLSGERDRFKTGFSAKTEELEKTKTDAEKLISTKENQLADLAEENLSLDSLTFRNQKMIFQLTKEQIADSLLLSKQTTELKEKELALANAELKQRQNEYLRNILLLLSGFVILLAGLIYARFRAKKKSAEALEEKNRLIEAERKRSDDLLLNILPPAIAAELKAEGRAQARSYEQATVMFVDFINFTRMAETLSPEALVEELDYCFRQFDHIISQFNVEKIKTIGDAYMCANGLSDRNALPDDMIKAALEMQEFLANLKLERDKRGLPFFEARIGIHTGPVVAGVVGAKKFAYDIWGDTVNMAARMEQACEPGRVNVSAATQALSKYLFKFENRGHIAAKNKGNMEMFYVAGRY